MSIEWLNPAALAGLAAVAGPLIVHLLTRRPAVRVPFPSVRFIAGSNVTAARPKRLADGLLWLLRAAMVAGAAAALAQPLVLSEARRAAWDARLSRAVVVDASASMSAAAERAQEAAAAERPGAAHAWTVESPHLGHGIAQAVDRLRAAPPSRREVVIVSDLQGGSVTAADIDAVPRSFGIRFVDAGKLPPSRTLHGLTLGAGHVEPRAETIEIGGQGTALRLTPVRTGLHGLRILGGGRDVDAMLRAVARAGAPAPSPDEPMALTFTAVPITSALAPWMTRTVLRMTRDERLAAAGRGHRVLQRGPPAPNSAWAVITRGVDGQPLVLAGASGRELVILVRSSPADFIAAAALQSAMLARRLVDAWQEEEVQRIPASTLAVWSRPPQPFVPGADSLTARDESDLRVAWLLVLGLLVVETTARRSPGRRTGEAHADAA